MNNSEINHQKVLSTKVKQYTICQQLGSGISSIVYLAINNDTGKQVAIKVIPKQYLDKDKKLMQLVKTQISILKNCNNENVVKCYGVFQSILSIFIVMEYCNGLNMEEYIHNKKHLSEDNAVWFLKQILNGFKGLHQIGAMHRDFKLANLLLHDRICKIADLGFAKQLKQQQLTSTFLGTQITMAPQILQGKPYGTTADIWSLGVVFYQMLAGKYPYKGLDKSELLKNIKFKQNDLANLRISFFAKNFIQGCLTIDPSQRITWMQIYNHPLLNKNAVELTYGISKVSNIFFQNQQYYRKQLTESQDSLILLRNSERKQLIIQQINKIQCKSSQCDAIYRHSAEAGESNRSLITYGVNYGTYLNQLSYPMKFLSLQFLDKVPQVDHYTPLYLIFKKCYYQIKQFHYIVQKRKNIFEISFLWSQFTACSVYTDVINVIGECLQRAQKIYLFVQNKLKKLIEQSGDKKLKHQLSMQAVNRRQDFFQLLEHYKNKYLKDLYQVLSRSEKNENIALIDLCEAILYYCDSKFMIYYSIDKEGIKRKANPQRIDWNYFKPVVFMDARMQLLNKFKLLLTN